MHTNTIIIVLSTVILGSYLFDMLSKKVKIPSVIVLIFSGIGLRLATNYLDISIPLLDVILPPLGTIGLILIVLEGSLDLSLSRDKAHLIRRASLAALLLVIFTTSMLAAIAVAIFHVSAWQAVLNVLPLGIISSAVAIPSAQALEPSNREFIIYESTLSDIIGVLLFNFASSGQVIVLSSFGAFGVNIVLTIVLAIIACLGLALLVTHIEHRIKFLPIISVLLLIYAVAKVWHLSPLLIVFIFGLFVNNAHTIRYKRFADFFRIERMENEIHKFSHLTAEIAFVIRTFFFIIFGYLADIQAILQWNTIIAGLLVVIVVIVIRIAYLSAVFFRTEHKVFPLALIAPRGLITILLFLSINPESGIPGINQALLMTVVIFSSLVMTGGILTGSGYSANNDINYESKLL